MSAKKSTNLNASAPKSPEGNELICSRTPAERDGLMRVGGLIFFRFAIFKVV
jgi:hypothetical protein